MFHRKLLDSTEAKKLIDGEQKVKGKGQRVKGVGRESCLNLDQFPFTLGFIPLTIYFNETPSCR
jgi:hypothetical protein